MLDKLLTEWPSAFNVVQVCTYWGEVKKRFNNLLMELVEKGGDLYKNVHILLLVSEKSDSKKVLTSTHSYHYRNNYFIVFNFKASSIKNIASDNFFTLGDRGLTNIYTIAKNIGKIDQ